MERHPLSRDIKGHETTRLMETFWGKGNPIASTFESAESFDFALDLVETATSTKDGKSFVLSKLAGKKISLGIHDQDELIAHSGLIIKPRGEVECGGSVIVQDHRGKFLMRDLNENRRNLLRKLALLDFQLTSFLLLGSNSVSYGAHLFDFKDLQMRTYFCNFGPYVYDRPFDVSQADDEAISDLSWKTLTTTTSSSTQVIGIRDNNPPQIAKGLLESLTPAAKEFISNLPISSKTAMETETDTENATRYSPAKIVIKILKRPYSNPRDILPEVKQSFMAGNNVIIQVPLQKDSSPIVQQITNIICQDYEGVMLIPTGLTIIDGYWSLTFASIQSNRLSHYKLMMARVVEKYDGSLRLLGNYSLAAINATQEM